MRLRYYKISNERNSLMIPYQSPKMTQADPFSNLLRLQGTGGGTPTDGGGEPQTPIQCEGSVPSGCETLFGPVIDTNCNNFPGGHYNINALIPDIACSEILSQCTVKINGQDASTFCTDSSFGVDGEADCGGACQVQWDCNTSSSCIGAASVEISCPGYESCETTVVTPT